MTDHIVSKLSVVQPYPKRTDGTRAFVGDADCGKMAARYVDALRTAVAWELVYDVLMSSIMVAWPVAVGIAFYSVFSSIAAALLLAIAVVVLIIRPASPSIDSLRSIIGRILLLSATAYVGY